MPWPPPRSGGRREVPRTAVDPLAAVARRPDRPVLLRLRGVLVPRRPVVVAWQQRYGQVEGFGADAAVPARRGPGRPPRRAGRRSEETDGVESATRRRPPASGAL